MDQATVLERMKAYFAQEDPRRDLDGFAETKAIELFEESIDVVDFLFYLEEELGPKIDASRIGPAMAQMTFGDLATKLAEVINAGDSVEQ